MIPTIVVNFFYGLGALMALLPVVWYLRARRTSRGRMTLRLMLGGFIAAAALMGLFVLIGWVLRGALGVEPHMFHDVMKWALLVFALFALGLTVLASLFGGTDFDSNAPPSG